MLSEPDEEGLLMFHSYATTRPVQHLVSGKARTYGGV